MSDIPGPALLRALTQRPFPWRHMVPRRRDVAKLAVALLAFLALFILAFLAGRLDADESLGTFRVTAYCPCRKCCGPHAKGIATDQTKLKPGMLCIAAPPSIAFGTRLFIRGYGVGTVHDRGGAITEGRLDVLFFLAGDKPPDYPLSHQRAKEWGVRGLEVRRVKQ